MDLRQIDLNLLVSLDALLAECNVTRAARRLHISQPALSAQLARLRQFFNDPLLLPAETGRGMTPTTRALALGDVRPADLFSVLLRELRVGVLLGVLLGALGFALTSVFYDVQVATVIALTLVAVCTLAATIGGAAPLAARALKGDPAVFSNPFITTFVDASGLIIYFLIARAVLGI